MIELNIHAQGLDEETMKQIYRIAATDAFKGPIAIMPDAHAGAGCCIGFTGEIGKYVIPCVVGVDIGCGVSGYLIENQNIDFEGLDEFIKTNIPIGMKHRTDEPNLTPYAKSIIKDAHSIQDKIGYNRHPASKQVGTLGGGNHFIEIGQGNTGTWVFVHSGSRNFGLTVARYYQSIATEGSKGLEGLPVEGGGKDYLSDMRTAQDFAYINRTIISNQIIKHLGAKVKYSIDCVHNYIALDNIVRKGAISAYKQEPVLIPLNMRDGTVLGYGKGNSLYNCSAPHGAGRLFGRGAMKKRLASGELTIEGFQKEMEGIYTTTANQSTIDESPMAYKPYEMIENYLKETVDVVDIIKPVYNLKAAE